MSTEGKQDQLSIRRAAWRGIRRNFDAIMLVASVTVALRIAVLLPLMLCADFGGKLPLWLGVAGSVVVYIVGVIPMRFWVREKMRRMFYSRHLNHHKKNVYETWLAAGLVRYLRGILWGLPFIAGIVYFTVFLRLLDAKTFWMPVRSLAVIVGQEPNLSTGLLITVALMALFGLLFAYGWWRDLPVEYLPVRSLETVKTMHWSRRILKKHRGEMVKNTIVNFFLCMPLFIGVAIVLVPYVRANVDFSVSMDILVSQVMRLLQTAPPKKTVMILGIVVLALYVPFWLIRKTRNAVLMARLIRENSHTSRSSSKKMDMLMQQAPPKKVDFHPSMVGNQALDARQTALINEERELAKDAAQMAREAEQDGNEAG